MYPHNTINMIPYRDQSTIKNVDTTSYNLVEGSSFPDAFRSRSEISSEGVKIVLITQIFVIWTFLFFRF